MTTFHLAAETLLGSARDLPWAPGAGRDERVTPAGYAELLASVGAAVVGRHTYNAFARAAQTHLLPEALWVLTRADPPPGTRAVSGDIADVQANLVAAARERDVWVLGGPSVVTAFLRRGLLDEVWTLAAPSTTAGSLRLTRHPCVPTNRPDDPVERVHPRTVHLMAEWAVDYPLWSDDPDLVGPIDADELGLSTALAMDLAAWNGAWEAAMTPMVDGAPHPAWTAAEERAWEAAAERLAVRLRAELGPDVVVTVRP